jgi:hypothetical protein
MDIIRTIARMALYLGGAAAASLLVFSMVMWFYTWARGGR